MGAADFWVSPRQLEAAPHRKKDPFRLELRPVPFWVGLYQKKGVQMGIFLFLNYVKLFLYLLYHVR